MVWELDLVHTAWIFFFSVLMRLLKVKTSSTVSYHPPHVLMRHICDYCVGTNLLLNPFMCEIQGWHLMQCFALKYVFSLAVHIFGS